jgi:hypothetical protein
LSTQTFAVAAALTKNFNNFALETFTLFFF